MRYPTKAVVLAAGFGTRMLPLSLDTPKPLMPFWRRPILDLLLEMLGRWGVQEVLINLHHQPDAFLQHLRRRAAHGPNVKGCRTGPRINLSFEPEILGSGGALARANWFLNEAPFWIINGDVVADLNPDPLVQALAERRCLAALWLHPEQGPRSVEMDSAGLISNFQSSRPGTAGTYTFCGLHLVRPAILDYIAPLRFSSIIQAYHRAMAAGWRIRGLVLPRAYWADVGTPASYLQAHAAVLDSFRRRQPGRRLCNTAALRSMTALRQRGVKIQGFVASAAKLVIAKGARLNNAVLWDGARIASGAIIENAIVGTRAEVAGRVPRLAVRSELLVSAGANALKHAQPSSDAQLAIALARLGWDPARTMLIPLAPRGSARSFTRLINGRRSVIMIRHSLKREENALYAAHSLFLQSIGWPVPAILKDVSTKQFVLVEDCGDLSLERLAALAKPARLEHYYRMVLLAVRRLHTEGTRLARRRRIELAAPFSADLYRWEREFFARQFLLAHLGVAPAQLDRILEELAAVAQVLQRAPLVLVHRDLQSSNILVHKGQVFFIDFQGMRFGAAAYDLASLLCDPYVELPQAKQIQLLAFYNAGLRGARAVAERLFWLAAVERLAQALGALARLSAQPDMVRFAKYIPAALRMLRRALQQSASCRTLAAVIENAIDKHFSI